MDRVYPFLVSGILLLVGLTTVARLEGWLNRYVTGDAEKSSRDDLPATLYHLQPQNLRHVVCYWVDMTQATALIIGPVLGVLILVNLSQVWVATAYAVSIAVGVGLILWLALAADASTYGARAGFLGLTPVIATGLVVDIAAGLIAYFAGAPVHHA